MTETNPKRYLSKRALEMSTLRSNNTSPMHFQHKQQINFQTMNRNKQVIERRRRSKQTIVEINQEKILRKTQKR